MKSIQQKLKSLIYVLVDLAYKRGAVRWTTLRSTTLGGQCPTQSLKQDWRLRHLFRHRTVPDASGPPLLSTTGQYLKIDAICYSNAPNLPKRMELHASVP